MGIKVSELIENETSSDEDFLIVIDKNQSVRKINKINLLKELTEELKATESKLETDINISANTLKQEISSLTLHNKLDNDTINKNLNSLTLRVTALEKKIVK